MRRACCGLVRFEIREKAGNHAGKKNERTNMNTNSFASECFPIRKHATPAELAEVAEKGAGLTACSPQFEQAAHEAAALLGSDLFEVRKAMMERAAANHAGDPGWPPYIYRKGVVF